MNYEDEIEDESLEEDDDITVIIAELDWKPIQDKLNWRDPNFTKDIVKRLKGITEESFAEEVNIPTVIAQKLEEIPTDYARYINKEGNKEHKDIT